LEKVRFRSPVGNLDGWRKMSLRNRIGVDLGRRLPLEDGIKWAAQNGVNYIDAQVDFNPNALESFDEAVAGGRK